MKNLFKFETDAAKVLFTLFAGITALSIVKTVCLTAFAVSRTKAGKDVNLKL